MDNDKRKVQAIVVGDKIVTEKSSDARELYNQSSFGSLNNDGVELSLLEGLYLFEKQKLDLKSSSGRTVKFESLMKKSVKSEPHFWVKYCVYKDMRNRGYIIKTALKFGADFRVYERGVKPGDDHAKWILYAVSERQQNSWHDFSSKNRVAHSTKKKLLLGVVDDESDVTYYEVKWVKP